MTGPKSPKHFAALASALHAYCLGFPEAYEDHPWGETVYKVKGKVFVFSGEFEGTYGLSTKLPVSGAVALMLPFAEPTGYGLGKSGWVSARFRPGDDVPLDMLKAWIDESYRAVAPKKLAATLPPLEGSGAGAEGSGVKSPAKAAPKAAAKAKPTAPAAKAAPKAAAKPAAKVKVAVKAADKPAAKATKKAAPKAKAAKIPAQKARTAK